jgi:hypothetical protein
MVVLKSRFLHAETLIIREIFKNFIFHPSTDTMEDKYIPNLLNSTQQLVSKTAPKKKLFLRKNNRSNHVFIPAVSNVCIALKYYS